MAKEQQPTQGENEPIEIPAIEYNKQTVSLMEQRSQTVELDQLGPIIINVDGTMQRITNWNTMSPTERANVMRIIPKRNSQRLEALRKLQE
jgi:hypothetical protein